MKSRKNKVVVGIDCQITFTDRPGAQLGVKGACEAMRKFGDGIDHSVAAIDELVLTFDWHPKNLLTSAGAKRIAGPDRKPVAGYTSISIEEFKAGKFSGITPVDHVWLAEYLHLLAEIGLKQMMVWPEHGLANSLQAELDPYVAAAVTHWERQNKRRALRHYKGLDPDREQYGAFGDEVPSRAGVLRFEEELVRHILSFNKKYWGGLVLSHCLMASFDQGMTLETPDRYSTHTILRDCTTIVPGFEEPTEQWLRAWQEKGVRVMNIAESGLY